jgi:hypothetical protein
VLEGVPSTEENTGVGETDEKGKIDQKEIKPLSNDQRIKESINRRYVLLSND